MFAHISGLRSRSSLTSRRTTTCSPRRWSSSTALRAPSSWRIASSRAPAPRRDAATLTPEAISAISAEAFSTPSNSSTRVARPAAPRPRYGPSPVNSLSPSLRTSDIVDDVSAFSLASRSTCSWTCRGSKGSSTSGSTSPSARARGRRTPSRRPRTSGSRRVSSRAASPAISSGAPPCLWTSTRRRSSTCGSTRPSATSPSPPTTPKSGRR